MKESLGFVIFFIRGGTAHCIFVQFGSTVSSGCFAYFSILFRRLNIAENFRCMLSDSVGGSVLIRALIYELSEINECKLRPQLHVVGLIKEMKYSYTKVYQPSCVAFTFQMTSFLPSQGHAYKGNYDGGTC